MSENRLYKKVFVQTSSTGAPQQVLAEENDDIAAIMKIAEVSLEKSVATIGGDPVENTYVPGPGAKIVLEPKKYSSGSEEAAG